MSTKQLIINGRISQREYMYNYTTFIGDIDEPIAKYLQENIYAKNVSVKYFISNTLKTKDELMINNLLKISGSLDADYSDAYSDITGYLWTDEQIMVGGHDLLAEINSNVGKFIYLQIDID